MPRTTFSELRKEVDARPGAKERIAEEEAEALDEIRIYEERQPERRAGVAEGDPRWLER